MSKDLEKNKDNLTDDAVLEGLRKRLGDDFVNAMDMNDLTEEQGAEVFEQSLRESLGDGFVDALDHFDNSP